MSVCMFTVSQDYRSIARAAQSFHDIFARLPASLVSLVQNPDEAEVSYLHMEPDIAQKMLEQVPRLRRTYKIGYCVWEASQLPEVHLKGLELLDEVWTASWHSWLMFSQVHPNVFWVPHVVEGAPKAQPEDVDTMRSMLNIGDEDFVFLHIGEEIARKNIDGLVQAFYHVRQRRPQARLVIKTNGEDEGLCVEESKGVMFCRGNASPSQMGALYDICDTYISAHMGEGWGLTLSDAMQLKKLCIATNYSGNTDFMTQANSLLVNYSLENIRPQDRYYLFTSAMSWAYAHQESLEQQMLTAMQLVRTQEAARLSERAYQDVRRFDARHVRCLVRQRLQTIGRQLALQKAASKTPLGV